MEDEKRKKERQQRQAEQQREWEEKFRQWYEYQNQQRGYGGYGQYTEYNNEQAYVNPTTEFKKKYEESCDLLGVGYNADKYEIKLAYRKRAKQYHPDLNKSPDATIMFQQINNAYEFLSDDNIDRYNNMR